MKAVVFSLGCKVNQCEGQSMITALRARGLDATDKLEPADIYIINTCSVTAEADRKSRQTVSRVLKLNKDASVYICGCSSQNDAEAFCAKQNVLIVSGTGGKNDLVERVLADSAPHKAVNIVSAPPVKYEDDLSPYHTKTRGYIKIQDGCNNFCSYCIIPYLRGRSRSRSIESIAEEARVAAEHTKEIVLTGIDTSSYGSDIGESLVSLVRRLGGVNIRKRIGSLECTVINDELLDAMAESGFCDHFHLSLQSGSASVLKRMNRKYTPEYYLNKVEKIRKVFPDAGITTDLIAGFGGETESEAVETEDFVRAVRFADIHVFPYSERKGTKAYSFPQTDKSVRQARAARLGNIARELRNGFYADRFGSEYEVYAETSEDGMTVGYTSNYIKVYSNVPVGGMEKVILKNLYKEGVKAVHYEK